MATINSTHQRITGMFSNMDTETMVKNMLSTQQLKVDSAYRSKTKSQWQLDAYKELNNTVTTFRNKYFSVLGTDSLMRSSTYNSFKVSSSNSDYVSVSANSNATATSFEIKAATMATSAKYVASGNVRDNANVNNITAIVESRRLQEPPITADTPISNIADIMGLTEGANLEFTVNGEAFSFAQTAKVEDVVSAVNASTAANVTMTFDETNRAFKFTGKDGTAPTLGGALAGADASGSVSTFRLNGTSVTGSTAISDIASTLGLKAGEDLSFSINGETFSFTSDKTLDDVMNAVNASTPAGASMSITDGRIRFESTASGKDAKITLTNITGALFSSATGMSQGAATSAIQRADNIATVLAKRGQSIADMQNQGLIDDDSNLNVTINGKDFKFNIYDTTLSGMMSEINTDETANARFNFSELTDKFELSSNATGADATLSASGLERIFNVASMTGAAGTDASITVDDGNGAYTLSQSSNTFTRDGLTFTINSNFDSTAAGSTQSAIKVGVTRDYTPTIDKVKAFITEYNSLVEKFNTYYTEEADRDYQPLTEDEEDAVTEEKAKELTEKAKEGILRNDASIGTMLTNIRSAVFSTLGESGLSASDLGISTVAWNSSTWKTEQGKLELDETKLQSALEKNPGAVQEAFAGSAKTDSAGNVTNAGGIFTRINASMSDFNTKMRTSKLSEAAKAVDDFQDKMEDLTTKLYEDEEKYWKKFSNMETMMSKLTSQTNAMYSALGLSS